MSKKTLSTVFALLIIGSLLLASCAPAATEAPADAGQPAETAVQSSTSVPVAEEPTEIVAEEAPASDVPENTLVYVEPGSYYTLDPFVTPWHAVPQYAAFDTLAAIRPDFSEYVPLLFESWEPATDNLSITGKLREGLKFQDGTPVNAEAIKWNYDMQLDEKLASPSGGDIRDNVKEVQVIDELTVKIVLKVPYAPIYALFYSIEMVSPTAYEKLGPDEFAQHPVGAGPWKVVEITPNVSVTYESFADYNWGPEWFENRAAPKTNLMVKYIEDEAVRYAALEAGEVHVANIPPAFLAKARENENIEIVEGLDTGVYYLGLNDEKAPFNDILFRQALNYAVNREELVMVGYEGNAIEAYGPLSPTEVGYNEEVDKVSKETSDDPEKAKALLDQAGWVEGPDGIREKDGKKAEFTLTCPTDPALKRIAETLQSQLLEVGIKLNVESIEAEVIKEMLNKGDFEMFLRVYALVDPSILTMMFHSSRIGSSNRNRVSDPELDTLLEAADQELNVKARMEKIKEISLRLVEKRYHIPLLTIKVFAGYRKDMIKGILFDKAGTAMLQGVSFIK